MGFHNLLWGVISSSIKQVLTLYPAMVFQIFLKVAEESGVDAETSGNLDVWAVYCSGRLSADC